MRKAAVIPKAAAAAVLLIISLILIFPSMSAMSGKLTGGTIDFGTAAASDYKDGAPVGGHLNCVLYSKDGGDLGGYYYLVPVKGQKNDIESVVLVKSDLSGDIHDTMIAIQREKGPEFGLELSGVMNDASSGEEKLAKEMLTLAKLSDITVEKYTIDLTTSVGTIAAKFFIGIALLVLAIICGVLTVQAINRNADVERIEEERITYKLEQDRKSGNTNADGTDKMFGDSEANYGVKPPKDGSAPSGGFNPTFQSQGSEQESGAGRSMSGFLSDDEDGFLGGGEEQNGGFFGSAPAPGGSGSQQGGYGALGNSDPFAGSMYGGSGSQGGSDPFAGSMYGGSGSQGGSDPFADSMYGDDDAGFFGQ